MMFVLFVISFMILLILNKLILGLALIPIALLSDYYSYSRSNPDNGFKYQISFSDDFIEIDYEKYILRDIEKLVIEIQEFDGQILNLGKAKRILNGTNNKVSFTYHELDISHKFYIPNKPRMNEFKDLYDIWYRNKIEFKEQCKGGMRTYCLDILNYKEIQEFKAKYNLDKNKHCA